MEEQQRQETQPVTDVLTRRHQVTLVALVAICLSILAVRSFVERVRHGRPINIERPFEVQQVELTIDLNSADWPELTLLPDISETMARRIVEHRSAHGEFPSLDAVQDVRGIGPRTFARIAPYLRPISSPDVSGELAVAK